MKETSVNEKNASLAVIILLGLALVYFFGSILFFPSLLPRADGWPNFVAIIAIAVSLPFFEIAIGKKGNIKKDPLKFAVFYSIVSAILSTIFLHQVSLLIGKPVDIANIRLSFFILFAGTLSGALCARYVQREKTEKKEGT